MSKTLSSTVTSKGQVTIPVEVRRLLRVGPHDKVSFVVDAGQVRLVPATDAVTRTKGALRGNAPMLSPSDEKDAAEEAIAREADGQDQ